MQIKIFSAPRLHEALAQVRQELGPDAVILDRLEERSASGESLWRVHAALDQEDIVNVKTEPKVSSPAIEATMLRLEKIASSLGDRDADQYRQAIAKRRVRDAFDHLLEIGVSPTNAFEMADDYAQHKPVAMPTLHWSERINPKKERAVLLFSGASGAGKTLLAAKLATHYSLKGISVALMTTDANRMGGSDVLSAYAAVLGVPFFVIRNQQDAEKAISETKSAQLVLIDSQGWNLRHVTGLRQQMDLWETLQCTHRLLVMPANMDEADGLAMLKQTPTMGLTQIAFSKLDETLSPGKVVNWAEASRMPMSYCSFGPEVPDQMGWLSPKALTALLVKHHRQHQEELEEEVIA
ncbi:MAG: GTP-binding protein [Mariprofundaceae bacterium]|nr:GTP-binding protein [Mariprofundaceae bacterium]